MKRIKTESMLSAPFEHAGLTTQIQSNGDVHVALPCEYSRAKFASVMAALIDAGNEPNYSTKEVNEVETAVLKYKAMPETGPTDINSAKEFTKFKEAYDISIWVVTKPAPSSTLDDILFLSSVREMELQYKGGLTQDELLEVFPADQEAAAIAFANKALANKNEQHRTHKRDVYRIAINDAAGENKQVVGYDEWRAAVRAANPDIADKLQFNGRVEQGAHTISAEVSGVDRSYGAYYPDEEYGLVFNDDDSAALGESLEFVDDGTGNVQVGQVIATTIGDYAYSASVEVDMEDPNKYEVQLYRAHLSNASDVKLISTAAGLDTVNIKEINKWLSSAVNQAEKGEEPPAEPLSPGDDVVIQMTNEAVQFLQTDFGDQESFEQYFTNKLRSKGLELKKRDMRYGSSLVYEVMRDGSNANYGSIVAAWFNTKKNTATYYDMNGRKVKSVSLEQAKVPLVKYSKKEGVGSPAVGESAVTSLRFKPDQYNEVPVGATVSVPEKPGFMLQAELQPDLDSDDPENYFVIDLYRLDKKVNRKQVLDSLGGIDGRDTNYINQLLQAMVQSLNEASAGAAQKEGVGSPEEGWCVVSSDRPRIVIDGPYLYRDDALAYKRKVPPEQSSDWLVLWGKEASDGSGEYVATRAVSPTESISPELARKNAFTESSEVDSGKYHINSDVRARQFYRHLVSGNHSQLAGAVESTDKLEAGVYHTWRDYEGVTHFDRKAIRSDEILRFEDSRYNEIINEINAFWDLKETYEELGLTHKRGVLMYGSPGAGKSVLIKQVVEDAVNSDHIVLYPKSLDGLATIIREFRDVEPDRQLLVVLEDVDGLIQYNEHSLLELFDGDDMVGNVCYLATTNYPDRLPARVMRSGRFDTKLEVKNPPKSGRIAYLKKKLEGRATDDEIASYADLTENFSFAQMREFVASAFAHKQSPLDAVARIRRNYTESRAALQEATTQWQVVDAKTGEELGRIERYRRSDGASRVWYRNPNDHSMNADSRGVLAAAYAYDKDAPNNTRKHKIVPLN